MKNVRHKTKPLHFKKKENFGCCFYDGAMAQLRFDATSMKLQDKTADLDLGVRLLKSLLEYVTSVRENFLDIQESTKRFSSIILNQYKHENKRKKTRKLGFGENSKNEAALSGNEKFKIKYFFPIIDKLKMCIKERFFAYESAERKFGFLYSFQIRDRSCHCCCCQILVYDLSFRLRYAIP